MCVEQCGCNLNHMAPHGGVEGFCTKIPEAGNGYGVPCVRRSERERSDGRRCVHFDMLWGRQAYSTTYTVPYIAPAIEARSTAGYTCPTLPWYFSDMARPSALLTPFSLSDKHMPQALVRRRPAAYVATAAAATDAASSFLRAAVFAPTSVR